MTKITVNKTPADQILNDAMASISVKDVRGRTFVLKKPGVLAQFHIVRAAGRDAENSTYMRMLMPLIYLDSIDGEAVYCPRDPLQIDALINRLGDDGIKTVMENVVETFGSRDAEADKQEVKK